MKIKIESHFRDEEWEGEIPDQRPENSTETYLEFIFRYFNRVDPGDDERLERIGYKLPSLTAGDTVVLENGERWFCLTVGWMRVPGYQGGEAS
jgi:hypothetical protein